MASFTSSFSASSPFVGGGVSTSTGFAQHWPPEAGCVGLSLGGVSGPLSVSSVTATVTDRARTLVARSITDGTSIKITSFAVGTGGYDVSNPLSALTVDPMDTSLSAEVFRDIINKVETATLDNTSKAFVGRIGPTELEAGIGEVALFAEILSSPFPAEVGTTFMFAVAHQPLNVKTRSHVVSYRIVLAL